MSVENKPLEPHRYRTIFWTSLALALILVGLACAPFVLTAQIARLVLARAMPAYNPQLDSASLSSSGGIVIRGLTLHDTGAMAAEPLVAAREIDAEFTWGELLQRKVRHVRVAGADVYARSNANSEVSLANLLIGSTPRPTHPAPPVWIGNLEVDGKIHREPIDGITASGGDWPLVVQLTTSGLPANPSRRVHLVLGDPSRPSAFSLSADVDAQSGAGTDRVTLHKLVARHASLALDARAIRQLVATLPPQLSGRISVSVADLSASGSASLGAPDARIVGELSFDGLQLRVPGKSATILGVEDASGAAKFDTPPVPGPSTTISIDRFVARKLSSSIDAASLRSYVAKLPTDIAGPVQTTLGELDFTGRLDARGRPSPHLSSDLHLVDLTVHVPSAGKHAVAVEHFDLSGALDAPLIRGSVADAHVSNGIVRCRALSIGENAVNSLDAAWTLDGPRLVLDRLSAGIFDGTLTGAASFDLVTHAMSRGDFQIKSVDIHKALVNVSQEHLDAVGKASGAAHLTVTDAGELSGNVDLAFDGPGTLRIGQIEEVKQMLVGNFGLDLANLAMHDLEHYPFRQGALHLESAGENSQLKIKFVRQPKSAADVVSPHKEVINGREVLVGSLVVPTIDMTIPITGQSLAEILAIVSGVHPLLQSAGTQPGK